MANEVAVLLYELEPPVPFTCADGAGIEISKVNPFETIKGNSTQNDRPNDCCCSNSG